MTGFPVVVVVVVAALAVVLLPTRINGFSPALVQVAPGRVVVRFREATTILRAERYERCSRRDAAKALVAAVSSSLVATTTTTPTTTTLDVANAAEAAVGTTTPAPAVAGGTVLVGGATTSSSIAKVAVWPGIENLEPMYEFKLSLDALAKAVVDDPKNWPYVQKRLDRFFKGSIFSEKNFYFGVGLQYMNDIKYTTGELPNYVIMDKEARYDALERTMKSLESLRSALATKETDATAIEGYAKDSQAALASWFSMIPPNDVKAVEELFVNVKKADLNRDGQLSADELAFLSPTEQELWRKRVDKFG